jgi:hypothetical protein
MATAFDAGPVFEVDYTLPDLRNGALTDVVPVVPRAAIPAKYHWVGIAGMPDNRAMAMYPSLARVMFAWMTVNDPTAPAVEVRAQAIVISAIRLGIRSFWRPTVQDLSAGEVAPGYATYRAPANATPAVAATATTQAVPAVNAVREGFTVNYQGATATTGNAALNAFTDLTAEEEEVARYAILLGMVVPVTQGWSLVKNGHHFISTGTPSARSAWNAVKRQWTTKCSAAVTTWVTAQNAWFEDIAFHKAGHPLDMGFKIALATSATTGPKLKAADFGSAAVRLPATAPEFEYAKVVKTLLVLVSPTLTGMGATVNTTALDTAIAGVMAETDPAARSNRIVAAVLLAHSQDAMIAFCAGMLETATDNSATGTSTVLRSMGLKRVMTENPTEHASGRTTYRAYAQAQRDAIAAGNMPNINITF